MKILIVIFPFFFSFSSKTPTSQSAKAVTRCCRGRGEAAWRNFHLFPSPVICPVSSNWLKNILVYIFFNNVFSDAPKFVFCVFPSLKTAHLYKKKKCEMPHQTLAAVSLDIRSDAVIFRPCLPACCVYFHIIL